jgi:hypothetical protein
MLDLVDMLSRSTREPGGSELAGRRNELRHEDYPATVTNMSALLLLLLYHNMHVIYAN